MVRYIVKLNMDCLNAVIYYMEAAAMSSAKVKIYLC